MEVLGTALAGAVLLDLCFPNLSRVGRVEQGGEVILIATTRHAIAEQNVEQGDAGHAQVEPVADLTSRR